MNDMSVDLYSKIESLKGLLSGYDIHELLTFFRVYQACNQSMNLVDRSIIESDLEFVQYLCLYHIKMGNKKLCFDNILKSIGLIQGISSDVFSNQLEKYRDFESAVGYVTAVKGGLFYRNCSYDQELIELLLELSAWLSDVSSLVSVFLKSIVYILMEFRLKLINILRDFFSNYGNNNPSHDELVRDLVTEINCGSFDNAFKINVDNACPIVCANKTEIEEAINFISNDEHNLNEIQLSNAIVLNPVSMKPILKSQGNSYALYSDSAIRTFFEDMLTMLWRAKVDNPSIDYYYKTRAKYTEEKVVSIFKKYFPFCDVIPNVIHDSDRAISKNKKLNEIDIILKYGDVIFIVEVKSHGIANKERMGDLKRFNDKISNTIIKANNQTYQFKKKLQSKKRASELIGNEINFTLDPKNKKIYRMAVIFREYGGAHSSRHNLKSIGMKYLPTKDFSVITITDLMVVFDLLSCPSERIDYLIQRMKFQNNTMVDGCDEIDLLSYYLINRFDIDYKKYRNGILQFPKEMPKAINVYKNSQFYYDDFDKPSKEILPEWESLISSLESEYGQNSRSVTFCLYRVTIEMQQQIINDINREAIEIKYNLGDYSSKSFLLEQKTNNTLLYFVLIRSKADYQKARSKLFSSKKFYLKNIHLIYINISNNNRMFAYEKLVVTKERNKSISSLVPA